MPTLDSLLVLFGTIDQAVVESRDRAIEATVERLLPGTTGRHAGWYRQARRLVFALQEQAQSDTGSRRVVPDTAMAPLPTLDEAVMAFTSPTTEVLPGEPPPADQPSVPERARAIYAAAVLAKIGQISPTTSSVCWPPPEQPDRRRLPA